MGYTFLKVASTSVRVRKYYILSNIQEILIQIPVNVKVMQ